MSWRILSTYERAIYNGRTFNQNRLPEGTRWSQSPCSIPIETSGRNLDFVLSTLESYALHVAIKEIIDRCMMVPYLDLVHACHLADHCVSRGMMDPLVAVFDRSDAACEYVLGLPTDESYDEHLTLAQDLARAARAKHAAEVAILELR